MENLAIDLTALSGHQGPPVLLEPDAAHLLAIGERLAGVVRESIMGAAVNLDGPVPFNAFLILHGSWLTLRCTWVKLDSPPYLAPLASLDAMGSC